MQKRIGFAAFNVIGLFKRSVSVAEVGVVFRMLVLPLTSYYFHS